MTENSLITLYCIVDDFIHRFLETSAGKMNLSFYYGKRGSKRRMSVTDVVTLNLILQAFRNVFRKVSESIKTNGVLKTDKKCIKNMLRK